VSLFANYDWSWRWNTSRRLGSVLIRWLFITDLFFLLARLLWSWRSTSSRLQLHDIIVVVGLGCFPHTHTDIVVCALFVIRSKAVSTTNSILAYNRIHWGFGALLGDWLLQLTLLLLLLLLILVVEVQTPAPRLRLKVHTLITATLPFTPLPSYPDYEEGDGGSDDGTQ
jgi:hypothetical protein